MDNPYQAPNADLKTSHNTQALKYVGFWPRTGAYIIDAILIMLLVFLMTGGMEAMVMDPENMPSLGIKLVTYILPIVLVLGFWIYKGATSGKMVVKAKSLGIILVIYILPIVIVFVIVLGFWIYKGATPGKMVVKAKIVNAKTGGHPSVLQFIGRYVGYIISIIPLGLGFFWIIWDKRKQGWHDKMSGTVVVSPSTDPENQISFDG